MFWLVIVFVLVLMGALGWFLLRLLTMPTFHPGAGGEADSSDRGQATRDHMDVKVERMRFESGADITWPESLGVIDSRVKGTAYYVTSHELAPRGTCRLVAEPENEYDRYAVAVYIGERKVGHVTASRCRAISELLGRLPGPIAVSCRMTGQNRYWISLPSAPGLRRFAASLENGDPTIA